MRKLSAITLILSSGTRVEIRELETEHPRFDLVMRSSAGAYHDEPAKQVSSELTRDDLIELRHGINALLNDSMNRAPGHITHDKD